ncbi:MAG: ribonuclease P protein component [Elusimicrobia bacterium]|nr:ribonuclease P protein component [Elusimicrobiota bacterium]
MNLPKKERRYQFLREEKIKRDKEFERIFLIGSRKIGDYFDLIFLAQEQKEKLPLRRIGIKISRKVAGAVLRNRFKRILREIFRHEKWNLQPNTDILLRLKSLPKERAAQFKILRDEFISLCRQAGIWQE